MTDQPEDDFEDEEGQLAELWASYLAADEDVQRMFLIELTSDPEYAAMAREILQRFPKPH